MRPKWVVVRRAVAGLLAGLAGVAAESAVQATAGPGSCLGRRATITGTAGSDRIPGTDARDVIVARGGADRIRSGPGNDIICAGPGPDLADGERGRDRVVGGEGDDAVLGSRGGDRLEAGRGEDEVLGDPEGHGSNDRLFGGPGSDSLGGWRGDDVIRGGEGTDTANFGAVHLRQPSPLVVNLTTGVASGEGSDSLEDVENLWHNRFECNCGPVTFIGDESANVLEDGGSLPGKKIVLRGRGGDDVLVPNAGDDIARGGRGDDVIQIGRNHDGVVGEPDGDDGFWGGSGVDAATIDYDHGDAANADLSTGTLFGPGMEEDTLIGVENLVGGSEDDTLRGDQGPNIIRGGGGDDELFGLGGDDTLRGGIGANSNDGGEDTDFCLDPNPANGATNCEAP